jgi:DNA-binding NarL/FixJ family response regulator
MAFRAMPASRRPVGAGGLNLTRQLHRRMLFVAPPDGIPQILIDNIELHFPWLAVQAIDGLEEACQVRSSSVRLVLVEANMAVRSAHLMQRMQGLYPKAILAVTFFDDRSIGDSVLHMVSSGLVRSVIPMNLVIDDWLSVIQLVLRGEDYYPPILIRKILDSPESVISQYDDDGYFDADEELEGKDLSMTELTARELQILNLVAKGQQNKTIASNLGLSENTVKIHIHNIIAKLGVHNRTEAAARYHESRSKSGDRRNGSLSAGPEG